MMMNQVMTNQMMKLTTKSFFTIKSPFFYFLSAQTLLCSHQVFCLLMFVPLFKQNKEHNTQQSKTEKKTELLIIKISEQNKIKQQNRAKK